MQQADQTTQDTLYSMIIEFNDAYAHATRVWQKYVSELNNDD